MSSTVRPSRQSVTFPPALAQRVKALAQTRKASASRVIVDLVEAGLEAQATDRRRFFELADRLTHATDRTEQKQLKEQLARLTFGG